MELAFLAATALGYLIGAIPSGVIISRRFGKRDLRQYGSGSTGATNALRTAGVKAGLVVFAADVVKGVAVVVLAGWLVGDRTSVIADLTFNAQAAQVIAAVAAIFGHSWSVFLRFRGGKGVSTFFGAFVVLSPVLALICAAITIGAIVVFRYVSLGSLLGATCAVLLLLPMVYLGWQPENYMLFAVPSMALIIFRHRDNIQRLLTGTERRLGDGARPANNA